MPAPTVWAILFFFMMLIIGFSSQVRNNDSLNNLFVKTLKQYNRYNINVLKIISQYIHIYILKFKIGFFIFSTVISLCYINDFDMLVVFNNGDSYKFHHRRISRSSEKKLEQLHALPSSDLYHVLPLGSSDDHQCKF